ncbi:hypothetical protein [Chryseobacterium sp. CBo1]|nr:hypothetical protein [Chryseobacterium sp. CBo1]
MSELKTELASVERKIQLSITPEPSEDAPTTIIDKATNKERSSIRL